MSAMDRIQAARKVVMWDAPAGLPAAHSFLGHFVHVLPNHFQNPSLFEMIVMKSSEKLQGQLYVLEM